MKKTTIHKYLMHWLPLLILKLFLPIICISFVYVAIDILLQANGGKNMIDIAYLTEMLEYIIMALTILICGVIVFDIAIKKTKNSSD